MQIKDNLPGWLAFERIRPALIVGLVLFAVSDALDLILSWLNVPSVVLILNSVAVGLLGGLLLLFYLSVSYERQNYKRAKEQMALVAEMNRHVRSALIAIEHSALLDNRQERLRKTGEAVACIDAVLTDLLPTIGSGEKREYPLSRSN
jgi:hypothetical protein